MIRILAIDDDEQILRLIRNALAREGYDVTALADPLELKRVKPEEYQLILLDVMMPGVDGFTLCEEIRDSVDCPILFLTAKTSETDIMKGLGIGGDDYITKPFSLMALRARVENIRKRTQDHRGHLYEIPGFRFDFEKLGFQVDGQEITLSAPEQKLLKLFVSHPGQTLPREMLTERIWASGMDFVDENALSVTISRLRKKLERKGAGAPIQTVYGIGYAWKPAKI